MHSSVLTSDRFASWPVLQALLKEGFFSYIDLAFAEHFSPKTEAVACCLAYLLFLARKSYISLSIIDDKIANPPLSHFANGENTALLHQLEQLIIKGKKALPKEWITFLTVRSREMTTPLCCFEDALYLQKYWIEETLSLEALERLAAFPSSLSFSKEAVQKALSILMQKTPLHAAQQKAIEQALYSPLTFIVGGPGTGKTHVAKKIVEALINLTCNCPDPIHIIITAATGKAVANIEQQWQEAENAPQCFLQAQTIYRLLHHLKSRFFLADLIIVDEASLIDSHQMAAFLQAVAPGCHLVFLGDPHQLPPVETGHLFIDLTLSALFQSAFLSKIHLTEPMRTKRRDLLSFFCHVKEGRAEEAWPLIDRSSSLEHIERCDSDRETERFFLSTLIASLPSPSFLASLSCQEGLKQCRQFCFLSPFRQGKRGTDYLNQCLASMLLAAHQKGVRLAFPILVTRNHYTLKLYNGDIGLWSFTYDGSSLEQLLQKKVGEIAFPARQHALSYFSKEKECRIIPAALLSEYGLAYGFSIHKSQGSEFQHVFIIVPDDASLMGRESLYTALTRAKEKITLFGSKKTIQEVISRSFILT